MTQHWSPALVWIVASLAFAGCGGSSRGQPAGGIHARLAYSEGGGLRVGDAPAGGAAALAGLPTADGILSIHGGSVRERRSGASRQPRRRRGTIDSS